MAITGGDLLNKVPSAQQQTLSSNYIDFAGGSTGWEQQYLPAYNRGMLVVTTNQGVMSHHEAVSKEIGGFLIGYVY